MNRHLRLGAAPLCYIHSGYSSDHMLTSQTVQNASNPSVLTKRLMKSSIGIFS